MGNQSSQTFLVFIRKISSSKFDDILFKGWRSPFIAFCLQRLGACRRTVSPIYIKLKIITSKLYNTSASIAVIKKAFFVDGVPKFVIVKEKFINKTESLTASHKLMKSHLTKHVQDLYNLSMQYNDLKSFLALLKYLYCQGPFWKKNLDGNSRLNYFFCLNNMLFSAWSLDLSVCLSAKLRLFDFL